MEQKRFAVAMLFTKNNGDATNHQLFLYDIYAFNENEALGIGINEAKNKYPDHLLFLKIVREFSPEQNTPSISELTEDLTKNNPDETRN